MTPLSFGTWIELTLKATLVLGVAAATCWAMWRASAATRHLVWASAVSALLVLPALSLVVPTLTLPVSLEPVRSSAAVVLPLVPIASPDRQMRESAQPVAARQRTPRAQVRSGVMAALAPLARVSTREVVLAVWAFGALALLLRLITALVSVRRITAAAETVDDEHWHEQLETASADLGLTRPPVLLWSQALSVPMTCGVTRPAILLPCAARQWDAARMRVVLLHELAHIRRRDCLMHCLAQAALALHWCNPLMWMALARLRAERERACDDLVLVAGTRGSDYAQHLLDIARQFRRQRMGVAAVAMARPSELEGRLLAILDPVRSRRPADRARLMWAIAVAALIVLPVSGLRLQARAVVPKAAQSTSTPTPTPTPTPAPTPTPTPAPTPSAAVGRQPPAGRQPAAGPQPATKGGVVGVRGGVAGGVAGGVGPVVADGDRENDDQDSSPSAIPDRTRTQAAQALTQALKDENAEVRAQAMQALAQMRSPLAFEPMVALLKDASPEVRHQAAFNLGQMNDPRAVGPLSAVLSDADAEVREQAVFALGQLHAREAATAIAGALKDTNADVRQQAAFALGQVGDASAIQPLVGALKDAADDVREQAAFALGQIGGTAAVPGLIEALADAKPDVRQQAAFALSQIGDASAVDALTTAMMKDTDPEVRQQAAFALGQVFGRGGHARERKRERQ